MLVTGNADLGTRRHQSTCTVVLGAYQTVN
jgi:hypothetical protein